MPPKIPRSTVAQVALKIYANDLEALSFSFGWLICRVMASDTHVTLRSLLSVNVSGVECARTESGEGVSGRAD